MKRAAIEECFRRLREANPHPRTELEYGSVFQLLVAVMLSAQATDRSVNLATRRFFPEHGTPEGLLALGEPGLTEAIRTIGIVLSLASIMTLAGLLVHHMTDKLPISL